MSLLVNGVQETQTVQAKKANKSTATGTATQNNTNLPGAEDSLDIKKSMPKLTPVTYTIKDGDSLQKIANKLGLKLTDLVDQLKASGKLPEDYEPSARHAHDISWMKEGKTIKVSHPATDFQKAAYQEYTEARTKEYYNKKAAAQKAAQEQQEPKGFWSNLFGW